MTVERMREVPAEDSPGEIIALLEFSDCRPGHTDHPRRFGCGDSFADPGILAQLADSFPKFIVIHILIDKGNAPRRPPFLPFFNYSKSSRL